MKTKASLAKVPVVLLNSASDFETWQISLRRLVAILGMSQALLYTVPMVRITSFRERFKSTAERVKKEASEAERAVVFVHRDGRRCNVTVRS